MITEKNSVDLLFLGNGINHKPLPSIMIILFIILLSFYIALITQEAMAKTPFRIKVNNGIGTVCVSSITDEMSDIHCQLASKNKELLFEYQSGIIAIGERFIVCEYEEGNIRAPPHLCLTHMNGPESEPEVVDFNNGTHYQILSQQWKDTLEWRIEVVDVCIKTHIIPLDTCTQIDPNKDQNDDIKKVQKLCYMIKARYISTERGLLTPDLC